LFRALSALHLLTAKGQVPTPPTSADNDPRATARDRQSLPGTPGRS
jgi:hypothetical protein